MWRISVLLAVPVAALHLAGVPLIGAAGIAVVIVVAVAAAAKPKR